MQLDFSSGKLIRKIIEAKIALVKFQNLLANGKTSTNKRTAKMESKLTRFYFKVLSARGQNFFNSVQLILISKILSSIYVNFLLEIVFKVNPFQNFLFGYSVINIWLNWRNFPAKKLRKNTGAQNTHAPNFFFNFCIV